MAHHVAGHRLTGVLEELAAVGADPPPLAIVLVHARVGQLALRPVAFDLGVRVAEEPAAGQDHLQPRAVAPEGQLAGGVGLAVVQHGVDRRFLQLAPVARGSRVGLAPQNLEGLEDHEGAIRQAEGGQVLLDPPLEDSFSLGLGFPGQLVVGR